jgi:hypothetical protein
VGAERDRPDLTLVDWLISLIAASRCVRGEEELVELALNLELDENRQADAVLDLL